MSRANPNFTFLKERVPKQRYTLLQGGTRSGKTYSTIYYIIWLCSKYSGLEIDICRDTFTALKATVWKDFKDILNKHNLYHPSLHNKTDHIYILNGNIINYYGADDPAKIHGRSRDILWINEANQLEEETVDQLFPRTRHRVIMDYNPALPTEHWLDRYITDYPPLITTYRDNPHLTRDQVLDIEQKKNNEYWWSIYGIGERTKPTGIIFNNWVEQPFNISLHYIWGMDFGYINDPTTLIKVAKDSKYIYVQEYVYERGLSTAQIGNILRQHIKPDDTIIADSAEPRLIQELYEMDFRIYPCKKGADSVRNGIAKMQDYVISVTPESKNIKLELNNYRFNTKLSNVPFDSHNHSIDAIRYAFEELVTEPTFFVG